LEKSQKLQDDRLSNLLPLILPRLKIKNPTLKLVKMALNIQNPIQTFEFFFETLPISSSQGSQWSGRVLFTKFEAFLWSSLLIS
jgi:hypothetical protein